MTQNTGTIRVLLVDDELAFNHFMQDQLNVEGFQCVACTTGSAALKTLAAESFDVLVTDLVLSPFDTVGSGLNLIKLVRRNQPSLPVVILTGESSVSKHELLEADVPVVEKGIDVIDVLAGVLLDAARVPHERRAVEHTREEPAAMVPDPTRLDSIIPILAKEIERLWEIKRSRVALPGEEHFQLPKPLQGFKSDIERRLMRYPYHENVFLMMKFREKNAELSSFICDTLLRHGLRGVRADADEWSITKNVYNPIAVLHCCKYGIALFDAPEAKQAFSANVAYELGMLHQQNKQCLILKHASLTSMPFDLIKDLYVPYDAELKVRAIVEKWIRELKADPPEVAATVGV